MAKKKKTKPAPSKNKTNRPPGRPTALPPDGPEGPPPADPTLPPLTDDEQRFVDEWLVDRHQTWAFMRAFPNCTSHDYARRRGSDFAHRPHVAAEMRAIRHAQRLRCQVDADAALEEMARLAFSDILDLFDPVTGLLRMPRHIPLQTRKAVQSVKISRERRTETTHRNTRTVVTDTVIEYKLWDKNAALSRLWEHLGLKTSLPPLEVFLGLLPQPLQNQVRTALVTPPSANGNGKH